MVLLIFYAIGSAIILIALVASLMSRKSELLKRSLTLLVLIHIVCLVIWLGPIAFAAFMLLVAVIGAVEIARCSGAAPGTAALAAGLAAALFVLLKLYGVWLYVMFAPCLIILVLLLLPKIEPVRAGLESWIFILGMVVPCAAAFSGVFDRASDHVIAMILFVQLNDSVAYLAGKKFGVHKLRFVSAISPNKTVEGYIAGAIGILAAAVLLHTVIPVYPLPGMGARMMWLAPAVFLASNAGDLAFSSIKRRLGVKDFSGLLAGHGGVLDRFDSLLCLSPVYLLLLGGGII